MDTMCQCSRHLSCPLWCITIIPSCPLTSLERRLQHVNSPLHFSMSYCTSLAFVCLLPLSKLKHRKSYSLGRPRIIFIIGMMALDKFHQHESECSPKSNGLYLHWICSSIWKPSLYSHTIFAVSEPVVSFVLDLAPSVPLSACRCSLGRFRLQIGRVPHVPIKWFDRLTSIKKGK